MKPRVIFAGTPEFAAVILRRIVEAGWDIPLVLSQPDAPSGRGRTVQPSPVSTAAAAAGLEVSTPAHITQAATDIRDAAAAVMLVAAYGQLIPAEVFSLPTHGALNVHASLLPQYRGASPITATLLAGDAETGVSLMRIEPGLDTGPVYATERLTIEPTDTTGRLTERLAELGAALAVRQVPRVIDGSLTAHPQDQSLATTTPLLTKDDGRIDWQQPAVQLERHLRAMQPWPGAWTMLGDRRVEIIAGHPLEPAAGLPGSISASGIVTTGRGGLQLEQVKPAGKRVMSAADWVRGLPESPTFS